MNNKTTVGKVQRGDRLRIPATWYNDVTDLLRKDINKNDIGRFRNSVLPALIIQVQNNTGGYLANFSVVGLYQPISNANILDIHKYPLLSADLPLADCPIGILQQPLNDGGIGKAVISGLTLVRVLVNDEGHKWVHNIEDNSDHLETVDFGIGKIIQFLENGSGGIGSIADTDSGDSVATELALIQLIGTKPVASENVLLMGKLDGALAYGGSATMSIWNDEGSGDVDTGEDEIVYDWLLKTGQEIAAGKNVVAALVGGKYRVIGAQCP